MTDEKDKKNLPALINGNLPAPIIDLQNWAEALRGKVQWLGPSVGDLSEDQMRALVTTEMSRGLRPYRPIMDQIRRLGELWVLNCKSDAVNLPRREVTKRMVRYCATAIRVDHLPTASVVCAFADGAQRVSADWYGIAFDEMHEALQWLSGTQGDDLVNMLDLSKNDDAYYTYAVGEHRRLAQFFWQTFGEPLYATPDRRRLATEEDTWTVHQAAETIRSSVLSGADVWDFEDNAAAADGDEHKIFGELCRCLPIRAPESDLPPVVRYWKPRLDKFSIVDKDLAFAAFDRWRSARGLLFIPYDNMFRQMSTAFGSYVNTKARVGKSGRGVRGVRLLPGD